ncbi:shikimate dehydrogenase [Chlorobium phaeovibrioides]|uniref:Shikimate dehydrogenase (NADP(+)) n=1 Tax=Chlorobium phaeovibrioides TaxID=1094 RepID=A0A5M8I9M9_CHLPH|nr:shikimate dehydrogenase [Chlorobium phaeovibrioides]KAA6232188.1 shikimate dehydrogenase [Chlorobium phaeovibrioides]
MRPATKIYGLIGRAVDYSYSPLIHNTAFGQLSLPCRYTIFNITEEHLVADALKGARALGLAGFSVTIPYKKTVVPLLDSLSEEAKSIQAVNTIVNHEGTLVGHNTDIAGFASPLLPHARSIQGRPVAILGSGGASLAAIEAFRTLFMPSEITLFMRNPAKETRMTDPAIKRCALGDLRESGSESSALLRDAAVVINATPVGTLGRPDAHMSPVPAESNLLHQGQIIYDMVYNPLDTPLLLAARKAGAVTIPGMEMLLAQGAAAFRLWTNLEMPMDAVRSALLNEIGATAI